MKTSVRSKRDPVQNLEESGCRKAVQTIKRLQREDNNEEKMKNPHRVCKWPVIIPCSAIEIIFYAIPTPLPHLKYLPHIHTHTWSRRFCKKPKHNPLECGDLSSNLMLFTIVLCANHTRDTLSLSHSQTARFRVDRLRRCAEFQPMESPLEYILWNMFRQNNEGFLQVVFLVRLIPYPSPSPDSMITH